MTKVYRGKISAAVHEAMSDAYEIGLHRQEDHARVRRVVPDRGGEAVARET